DTHHSGDPLQQVRAVVPSLPPPVPPPAPGSPPVPPAPPPPGGQHRSGHGGGSPVRPQPGGQISARATFAHQHTLVDNTITFVNEPLMGFLAFIRHLSWPNLRIY